MSNSMKRLLMGALSLVITLCTQFPSRYERIEPNALRAIGFSYQPYAEGAPGDTMTVRAYFGGEKVVSVDWSYSTDHVIDGYGTDTVLNIREVPIIDESSNLPDSIAISFVIPDSIFFTTKGLSSRVYDAVRGALPPGMRSLSQKEHASFLKDLMAIDPSDPATVLPFIGAWGEKMGITALDSSALETVMTVGGILLRVFSVPGVLYATATSETGKKLKIRGDFTIRYNRNLAGTDFESLLPVNHNPSVRWIGVYTVRKKGYSSFNPYDTAYSGKYTFNYLYNAIFPDSVDDTILIDTGCTYFFAADSGIVSYTLKAGTRVIDSISGKDTTWRTLDSDLSVSDTAIDRFNVQTIVNGAAKDTTETETWSYDWHYQNLDLDSVTEPLDSLFMVAGRGGSWIVPSLPSLDPKMTHARIWVTVRDAYIDFNRPVGITIRTADVYFKYSEAYRKRRN